MWKIIDSYSTWANRHGHVVDFLSFVTNNVSINVSQEYCIEKEIGLSRDICFNMDTPLTQKQVVNIGMPHVNQVCLSFPALALFPNPSPADKTCRYQWALYLEWVLQTCHRVKPNMAAMEALNYIGFSPPTRSFMFTCYVKTVQGDWNQASGPPWPPYLASLFAQLVTGRSHSIYIYIYWRDRPDPSLPYALQLTNIATRCGRTMVTLMEKGEKCGRGYLAVGTNLKGHPLETQLHTYTVYMVKLYPYTNLLHIKKLLHTW